MQFATACEQQKLNRRWGDRCIMWSHFVYIQGVTNSVSHFHSHCRFSLGQYLYICHIVVTAWSFFKGYLSQLCFNPFIQCHLPLQIFSDPWIMVPLLCVTVVPSLICLYNLGSECSFVSLHCRIHEATLSISICPLYHFPYVWYIVEVCLLPVLFHMYFLKVNWATQRKKMTKNMSWYCPSFSSPSSVFLLVLFFLPLLPLIFFFVYAY